MKLVLKNSTSYTVLDSSTSEKISIEAEISQLETIQSSFTTDNLSTFKFTTDDGTLMGEYKDKKYNYLEYSDGIATLYLASVDISEKERRSMQSQIDELTTVIIPEILGIIIESQMGGEV